MSGRFCALWKNREFTTQTNDWSLLKQVPLALSFLCYFLKFLLC
jgi:hypothetical protein